jgi:hypothetical protein
VCAHARTPQNAVFSTKIFKNHKLDCFDDSATLSLCRKRRFFLAENPFWQQKSPPVSDGQLLRSNQNKSQKHSRSLERGQEYITVLKKGVENEETGNLLFMPAKHA